MPEIVKSKIRNIPDFPKPGIMFKDITTALKDADTFKRIVNFLTEEFKDLGAERLNSPSALRRLGSIAQAAGREDIATEIRPEATVAATPIPIDPSSASDEIAWTDPEWNIAWDAMSMDLIGMTVER